MLSFLFANSKLHLDKLQAFPEIQLSSALSDSTAVEVIDEEIIPHFRTPSGKTTKPQVLSKQHTALKRKLPERVTSILQLHYESSREGRGFKSQLSLVKTFVQVLQYFSHQHKNSLVKKVLEENARNHQSVWDPGGQNKLGVHNSYSEPQQMDGESRLSKFLQSSRCPADVQSMLSIRRSSRMERALPGSMLGIYGVPTVIDLEQTLANSIFV